MNQQKLNSVNKADFWRFLGHFCKYQSVFLIVMYFMWICGLKGHATSEGANFFEAAVSLPDRNRVEQAEAGNGSLAGAYLAPLKETYNFGNAFDKKAYTDLIDEVDFRGIRACTGLIISFFATLHAWKKTNEASKQITANAKETNTHAK